MVETNAVPPVDALYQSITFPADVAIKDATVALPQKLCAEAVGAAGRVLIVTNTAVLLALKQLVVEFCDSA